MVSFVPLARAWTRDVSGFRDFSRTVGAGLYSKLCRMCDASAARFYRLIQFLFLRISAGSMPHKTGSRYIGVDLIHPLMSLKHSLRDESSLWQWLEWHQTREQYSATEKHNAGAAVLNVVKSAPQWLLASLFIKLMRLVVLAAVFSRCYSNDNVQSRVIPRCFGLRSCFTVWPPIFTCSLQLAKRLARWSTLHTVFFSV